MAIAAYVISMVIVTLTACRMPSSEQPDLDTSDLASIPEIAYELDPKKVSQTWEGWGTSLAWWANVVGDTEYASEWADLFFTDKELDFLGKKTPGLKLNIVRYNIGGTGRPGDTTERLEKNPLASPEYRDRWYAAIEGYWKNWSDPSPESDSWDWNRDRAQRRILQLAISRGATRVEFFSNSPMWWMKDSKSAAGGTLQPWNRGDFATYLATVVDHAQSHWGIPVASLSPFNEPSAGWWTYPKNQEGANIDGETRQAVIDLLRKELQKRNIETSIAGADENTIAHVDETHVYDRLNVHSYVGTDPNRDNRARKQLRESIQNKKLWSSEFGDGDASGAALARTILDDVLHLRPNAWIYWQAVEPHQNPWGLANGVFGQSPVAPNRGRPTALPNKYFVFAHFTRFISDDMQILSQEDESAIVAYSKTRRILAVVASNLTDSDRMVAWNLRPFEFDDDVTFDVYRTTFDGRVQYRNESLTIAAGLLRLPIQRQSIASISIQMPP